MKEDRLTKDLWYKREVFTFIRIVTRLAKIKVMDLGGMVASTNNRRLLAHIAKEQGKS